MSPPAHRHARRRSEHVLTTWQCCADGPDPILPSRSPRPARGCRPGHDWIYRRIRLGARTVEWRVGIGVRGEERSRSARRVDEAFDHSSPGGRGGCELVLRVGEELEVCICVDDDIIARETKERQLEQVDALKIEWPPCESSHKGIHHAPLGTLAERQACLGAFAGAVTGASDCTREPVLTSKASIAHSYP